MNKVLRWNIGGVAVLGIGCLLLGLRGPQSPHLPPLGYILFCRGTVGIGVVELFTGYVLWLVHRGTNSERLMGASLLPIVIGFLAFAVPFLL